jgi:hypothetical protein
MRRSLLILVTLLAAIGCGSDDVAPTVEIMEVSPDSLDPASDTADDLTILVRYRDPDGDLGGGVADVHDCRADGLVVSLAIPPIASEQAIEDGVPIEGMLEIVIPDVGEVEADSAAPAACAELGVDGPVAGEVVFCVVLTDAAGNPGAGDCTAPVAIGPAE